MKTICIVQARVKSTRFYGKIFEEIEGRPMLWHVYQRARQIVGVDEVLVATSFSEEDRRIVDWCQLHRIPVARGGNANENDVLSRYWDVVMTMKADVIVRVTADCPCLDPKISAEVLRLFQEAGAEFATNRGQNPYPDGYDTEVFSYGLLAAAYWGAKDAKDREHVTPWMIRNAKPLVEVEYAGPPADVKLSVDTEEDLERVREVYAGIEAVATHLDDTAHGKPKKGKRG